MSELKGMHYLKNKLAMKQPRVRTRYDYYEMKHTVEDFGISTPPDLRYFMGALGWCARAVDTLEDRLVFREFTNDIYEINDIYRDNNKDILFDAAMTGALISSCDFIYISVADDGSPRLQVIDGYNATGILDPITYLLREGYAVLERDSDGSVIMEAYMTPDVTEIYVKGRLQQSVPNKAGYCLLVPIVYRPDAVGYVQPYVDSPLDFEAVGRTVFSNMITRSRKRVWIMTPYLIIDDGMAETLTNAAKAGIDVRIITPGIPDKKHVYEMTRANYPALLEGKVRIFEYTPGFIHSKLFLADDDIAAVGTVNLDFRSLYLHFEDGVWIYRGNCMEQIRQDFDETFPMCREVTAEQAREVGLLRKLYRAVLRLLSPLM